MTADRLREAARVLRERAEAAMPGAWWTDGITVRGGAEGRSVASSTNADRANATYIATMHPGVGLALADWLDLVGAWRDEGLGLMPLGNLADAWLDVERQANVLADLILGAES